MNSSIPFIRPRLLLLAHSCNPEIGSEPGVGWNRALEASKEFSTWVVCDEETNRTPVERFLQLHGPIPNVQFSFVDSGRLEQRLRKLPGTYWVRYNLWHRRAYQVACRLHRQVNFDLVHQLNLCGFREPGYLWKLGVPLVWGPLGGAQNYPWRFLRSAGFSGAVSESLRNLLNCWQMRIGRRVGKAARKSKVVLAATTTNARALAPRCISPPRVLLEVGIHLPPRQTRNFHRPEPLRVLWSGVFEHRKSLHLLLEAVAVLPADMIGEVRILGRGPLEARWKKIARRLGIDSRCRWLGWIDRQLTTLQYQWADVFAFTSLRDTTGTVLLESLAAGTPVVCLDHQGAADVVTDECGVKLPVTNPRDVVRRLRESLIRLHFDRDELARLSAGARRRAEHFTWERQGERMSAIYREVFSSDEGGVEISCRATETAAERRLASVDTSDHPLSVAAPIVAARALLSERRE
ncbi:MAG: glycosyltransferase [Pirellulales bacterium]|nr:glycosyltransferase [Pirellulales bacterium]